MTTLATTSAAPVVSSNASAHTMDARASTVKRIKFATDFFTNKVSRRGHNVAASLASPCHNVDAKRRRAPGWAPFTP